MSIAQKTIKGLPQKPGVYFFKSRLGKALYIGKAANIKKRVQSHFARPSFKEMHFNFLKDVKKITWEITDSEIEALLLEAAMIKKYWPPHNVAWRDDKNYFYVGITNEEYPRVFLTHQMAVAKIKNQKSKIKNTIQNSKRGILFTTHYPLPTQYVGPFVDGQALKMTLRYLRKIFPYRTCGKIPHRTCMWFEIHEKDAPCEGIINPKEYQKHIQNLIRLLEGKKEKVFSALKKQMHRLAKKEEFEKAAKIRDQLEAFYNVTSHARIFSGGEVASQVALRELKQILRLETIPHRIEGYDISNIQGKEATGSMVVFIDGQPAKEHYRRFKIKAQGIPNDIAMLKETIARRLAHQEWLYPNLMLIDGGRAHLATASRSMSTFPYDRKETWTRVIALAKRQNLLYLETQRDSIPMKNLPQSARNLLAYIRNEAHRFAINYHRKLHRKQFQEK